MPNINRFIYAIFHTMRVIYLAKAFSRSTTARRNRLWDTVPAQCIRLRPTRDRHPQRVNSIIRTPIVTDRQNLTMNRCSLVTCMRSSREPSILSPTYLYLWLCFWTRLGDWIIAKNVKNVNENLIIFFVLLYSTNTYQNAVIRRSVYKSTNSNNDFRLSMLWLIVNDLWQGVIIHFNEYPATA